MTNLLTFVHSTRQEFVTRKPTGNARNVTRNVASHLMFPHAQLLSEVGTRRAFLFTVAIVEHWMITLMFPYAWVFALGRSGTTRHWRIDYRCSTMTCQFIETTLPAILTVSTVARLFTLMLSTIKLASTEKKALVFSVHTTNFITLMAATRTLLITALVT